MKLKNIGMYLRDPSVMLLGLAKWGYLRWLSDKAYLKLSYRIKEKEKLNLDNPKTYNEKLQWLKLYDRKPIYTRMVDKYEAKKFVAEQIGEEYVVPTLGVWDRFEDIDFDALPEKFVLKCTHDSGDLAICHNKAEFDIEAARRQFTSSLKRNYYWSSREWAYKDVKPRIIAEQYMEDTETQELRDYKFFVFNGSVKIFYITSGRKAGDRRTDFFDLDLNHLDLRDCDEMADVPPAFPKNLDKMMELAEKLSVGIPQLRVDFYEVDGQIYVGEFTFYYCGGHVPFKPKKWDAIWGEWLELPAIKD